MTREEARDFLYTKTKSYSGKIEINRELVDIVEIDELINKIYDDFESRVCKNCKHFKSKSGLCESWENGKMNEASFFNVDENFCCNRFERREDERN